MSTGTETVIQSLALVIEVASLCEYKGCMILTHDIGAKCMSYCCDMVLDCITVNKDMHDNRVLCGNRVVHNNRVVYDNWVVHDKRHDSRGMDDIVWCMLI